MNEAMLSALRTRRSVKPDLLVEPAPSAQDLEDILTIAARVPDHKKLAPWRFIVISGEARAKAGAICAEACKAEDSEPSPIRLETEANRFSRAPLVIAVVSRVTPRPGAPEWEQILSAGAAAMNLCHAANARGYATCWITEWIAYSPIVRRGFGLSESERFVGFIHIGTAKETPTDRDRPALADIVQTFA